MVHQLAAGAVSSMRSMGQLPRSQNSRSSTWFRSFFLVRPQVPEFRWYFQEHKFGLEAVGEFPENQYPNSSICSFPIAVSDCSTTSCYPCAGTLTWNKILQGVKPPHQSCLQLWGQRCVTIFVLSSLDQPKFGRTKATMGL